jgi:hypothetical protein
MRELLYSFNYAWFLMEEWIKKYCPEAHGNEDFMKLTEEFGAYEAKRLSRVLDISDGGVDVLIKFLNHSHWTVFEEMEAEKVSATSFKMRTLNCTTQKAAKKWGMGYYDCSSSGNLIRTGFYKQTNPNARIERIFTPPDELPKGISESVSCEWLITI